MYCDCDCVCFVDRNYGVTRDALIAIPDSIANIKGFVILVKRSELEQFNSWNTVTDSGRLVKVIQSKKEI